MSDGFSKKLRKQLSEQLLQVRLERNLSTTDVALKSSLRLSDIEDIEQGKKIGFSKYRTLAVYYGKTIKLNLVDIL